MRRGKLLDLLLVFLFAAVLVKPLFQAKYLNRWDSIESTFIADGRFLSAHLPHPQWQALWYCGTRYDYLYPPVIRYGTAFFTRFFVPVKAYHVFTALLYCFSCVGVYLLVWIGSRSRAAASLSSVASVLVSPVYLVTPVVWRSEALSPWHLWILTRYGEGPHVSSLALLPFALVFSWLAIQRGSAWLPLAAFCCALVALTNFYGATALAIFYPILVWSVWLTHRRSGIMFRAAAIPALAYGFSAFWLVPSYLRTTLANMQYVSSRGNTWSAAVLVIVTAAFLAISFAAASRKPQRAYSVFLAGSLTFFGLDVLGSLYFKFRVIGEPHRLLSELDLVLILCAVELLRRLWEWRPQPIWQARVGRAAAAVIVLATLWSARHYVRHAWDIYPREFDYHKRVEYRMSEWIATHLPQSRTFAAGSVRFWFDTWHDLAQTGGGSDQGLINEQEYKARWEIMMGSNPEMAIRWLTALGADAVIVSGKQSQEMYHDFTLPEKFTSVLTVLYDDGQGNVIYQVPRRYPSLARVVDRARFAALPPLEQSNLDRLRAYTAVIEQGPDAPTSTAWRGTDNLSVHAHLGGGQALLVQVTYDPSWHAYAAGRPLAIHKDPSTHFIVIDAQPGADDITLAFETPLENRIGWSLTVISLLLSGALVASAARRP